MSATTIWISVSHASRRARVMWRECGILTGKPFAGMRNPLESGKFVTVQLDEEKFCDARSVKPFAQKQNPRTRRGFSRDNLRQTRTKTCAARITTSGGVILAQRNSLSSGRLGTLVFKKERQMRQLTQYRAMPDDTRAPAFALNASLASQGRPLEWPPSFPINRPSAAGKESGRC